MVTVCLFLLVIFLCTIQDMTADTVSNQLTISNKIQPIQEDNIFRDLEYFNWCNSIIKGEDDKYHLIYSRWSREKSFDAWLTHSEIAHAISERPEGPYHYVNTLIKFHQTDYKKGEFITAHNPKIKYFDGKYYLYFISTKFNQDITNDELIEIAKKGGQHKKWKILRENQRTYVATCESLNGVWNINKTPLLEPNGPIETLVVNPAITQGPDKKYYLIVKGDKPGTTRFERNQVVAVSDYPDRDFKIQPKPVIQDWDTEDVSIWYDDKTSRFYAVFHAHTYIGMMTSKNGLDWEKADDFILTKKNLKRANNQSPILPNRMERPFVYTENGQVSVLALAIKKGNDTYILTIPLKEPTILADHWKYIGVAINEPGYHVYGSSPIIDEQGNIHLFSSRWKIENTFDPGWRSHSEIAHYVASNPEGPFHFKETVLRGSGENTWDKYGAHNPTIHKVGSKYVLLYIANDNFKQPVHPKNQKIGMMIADSLDGPWKKVGKDGCILRPSTNPKHWTYKAWNGVNNPALLQHPNGGYLLYFKSSRNGIATMGVAFAEHIEGPYVMYPDPVTNNQKIIEDGYAFIYENKICLLTCDNHGIIEQGGGILWKSDDGVHFDENEQGFYLFKRYLRPEQYKNERHIYGNLRKLERPQLLMKDGKPWYLYAPTGTNINGGANVVPYILKYIE